MMISLKSFIKKRIEKNNLIFSISFLIFIAYVAFYIGGISQVPFHPDEATQIYMSSDIDTMLHHFSDLFWRPENTGDLKQHYHELDAPLSRYLIGIGRLVTSKPQLVADWDWSKSWVQNQSAGALPDPGLLFIARLSVAIWTLFSLVFLFDLVQRMVNPYTALIAVLIYAFNPLVLLHTRRAMAESALLFFIIFFLWVMIRFPQKSILLGVSLALAFCSKQSAILLFFPGILAVIVSTIRPGKLMTAVFRTGLFLLSFLLISALLNPFIWSDPLHSILSAIKDRQNLTTQQQNQIFSTNPEKNIADLPNQVAAAIGSVFFQPPAVADVANYLENTQSTAQQYFDNPLNLLFHDPISSTIFLVVILLGFILSCLNLFHQNERALNWFLLILSFLCVFVGLIWNITLPFQRYYLPLIPFISIWASLAITTPFVKTA